jgi:ribosomal protein S18 acetylase RimI-like enzyme
MATFTLRDATADDLDALYSIHIAAMRDYVSATWGWHDAFQESLFRERYPNAPRQVILCDGEIAGFIETEEHHAYFFLGNLELDPRFQRRGIGRKLIQQFCERAMHLGLPVRLQVLKVNRDARRLYERLGFQQTGETETHHELEWRPG